MNTLDRPDFDEYIHEMCSWPIERIVDEVADDEDLRGYLATCAGNYRNQLDWDEYNWKHRDESKVSPDICYFYETARFLKDWNWMISEKFSEEADRKTIAEWAPSILRALDQRMQSQHSQNVKKRLEKENEEREKKAQKERLEKFANKIPVDFQGASAEKLSDKWQKILGNVMLGHSFLIYSAPGAGKTFFGYSLGFEVLRKGKTFVMTRLFKLMQQISNSAMQSRYSADEIIDMDYVKSCDVLVIDEADKITMADTAFRNFSYLIDRRCEEHLVTIVLCNAADTNDIVQKLGPSICDRFQSKKWKAHILKIDVEQSMRKKETTA